MQPPFSSLGGFQLRWRHHSCSQTPIWNWRLIKSHRVGKGFSLKISQLALDHWISNLAAHVESHGGVFRNAEALGVTFRDSGLLGMDAWAELLDNSILQKISRATALDHWFSKCNVHVSHLGVLLIWFDSVSLRWGLRYHFSDKSQTAVKAPDLQTKL